MISGFKPGMRLRDRGDYDVAAGIGPALDYATATPEQVQAAFNEYAAGLEPVLASVQRQAPEQLKPDVAAFIEVNRRVAEFTVT